MKREGSRFTIDEVNKVVANWEQIAKEKGGEFELRKRTYSDRDVLEQITNYKRKDVVYNCLLFFDIYIPHKQNRIKIASSEVKMPILSCKFNSFKQFNFSIRNEDFIDKVSKCFGQDEVQVNNRKFDSKFFIETNEPKLLKAFLNLKITDWLEKTKIAYFDYNSQKSKNTLSIYCSINEMDKRKIKQTIDMFKYCLTRLNDLALK
ncbi:hypothetical protein L3073_09745 [Ancylomarina sp. DW003]|nr:hypothetical protein [Ancylomarina sp. DW003]MDE5422487.1 hypothetical protein [Ancylomarina sp. DW003]